MYSRGKSFIIRLKSKIVNVNKLPFHFSQISEESTINQLKQKIEIILDIPVLHQKLLHIGRTLVDESTIGSYTNITEGTKLTLVVKKPEPLNEVIHKYFRKYYTEQQSDVLTREFMKDFDSKVKQLSLNDLERIATGLVQ